MALDLPTVGEMNAQPRACPKGVARVIDRIEKKKARESQERRCRKRVNVRDKRHCRVASCKETSVHLHHITFRAQGGKWQTCNIVSLCVTHHQFVHAGLLSITGDADKKLTFEGRITV